MELEAILKGEQRLARAKLESLDGELLHTVAMFYTQLLGISLT